MRDQDTFCLVETDLFNGPARALIFELTQPYLEQEGITATELVFNRSRQRHLANDGNRLADAIQRTAGLQSQQTRQPILDRRRELNTIVSQAMRLIDGLTRQTTSEFEMTGEALSRLCEETADRGFIRTAIIVAAGLSQRPDWAGKITFCLGLLESGATGDIAMLLEQTLAELLRLEPAGSVFGFSDVPRSVIDTCLGMADCSAAVPPPSAFPPGTSASDLPVQERIRGYLQATQAGGEIRDALCDRVSDALDLPGNLVDEGGLPEWEYLLSVKRRIADSPSFAEDPVLRQALARRFLRLAQAEQLNLTLAGIPVFGKKVLYLAQLYPEVQDGQARRDLLAVLTFYLEHRDFSSQFAESGTSVEDMFALAQKIQEALENPELPDHRRDRFRTGILKQYMEIKRLAERRRDPRVIGGPNDAVNVAGQRLTLRNWSPLGVLFGPAQGQFNPGDTLSITIEVSNPQIDMQFEASADVIRVYDGLIAARYYCSDPEVEQRIRSYFGK
jgi:hypothetical protein